METRDLTIALLLATASLCCSVVVGSAFLLLLGAEAPAREDWPAWCAAAALACAGVATLVALTRDTGGLKLRALGVAWLFAFAWPLSGIPAPAALLATVGTSLALAWGLEDEHAGGGVAAAALAAVAVGLLAVAYAAAPAPYAPPAEARAAAPDARAAPATGAPSPPASIGDRAARAAARPSPARFVRAYYRALGRRDFDTAWRSLSPAVRSVFGGFAAWRAGFGATLSSVPSGLDVDVVPGGATVSLVLTARDRAGCGVLVQRFAVRWTLRRTHRSWRAAALTGAPLSSAPAPCPANGGH